MKVLFWFGMVVLILGVASLFVPIPQTQRQGIKAGDLSIGVETHDSQKVSPIVSAVLILGGAGMMIGGKAKA